MFFLNIIKRSIFLKHNKKACVKFVKILYIYKTNNKNEKNSFATAVLNQKYFEKKKKEKHVLKTNYFKIIQFQC